MGSQQTEKTFVIITGLSGAGKTHALHSLEDLGFFCVDNLLPALLPNFAALCLNAKPEIDRVALVIDVRGGTFFNDMFQALAQLNKLGYPFEILFLEASTDVLVKRFKETRRRHPLSKEGRLLEDILLERQRLEDLRGIANKIIDTSDLKPSELKDQVVELYGPQNNRTGLHITVMSFGYKYGIPLDADLVIDVRFLPNPYYVPELRNQTGCDQDVHDYVFQAPITNEFLEKYLALLSFLLPHYLKEGKTHLVVAIGCTGGQHRSVTLANAIFQMFASNEYRVNVRHRDMLKSPTGEEPI